MIITYLKKLINSWKGYFLYQRLSAEERKVTFYSEGREYQKFFYPIIELLVKSSLTRVIFLSSDINDTILKSPNNKIISIYIGSGSARTALFSSLKPCVFVSTTPDLNNFYLKRSPYDVNYTYIHHSMVSMHMIYRAEAFDHFDTIFCVGPHHEKEIRKREKLYNLPKKDLLPQGYAPLDGLINEYSNIDLNKVTPGKPNITVLIAPSWGKNGLIENHSIEILEALLTNNYKVLFRPHKQTRKNFSQLISKIKTNFVSHPNFQFDGDTATFDSYFKSDIMVSDWSGAALEFAFGLERPVLICRCSAQSKQSRL